MTIQTKFNLGQSVRDTGFRAREFEIGEIRVQVWTRERAALPDQVVTLTEYRSVNVSQTGVTVARGTWVSEKYLEAA